MNYELACAYQASRLSSGKVACAYQASRFCRVKLRSGRSLPLSFKNKRLGTWQNLGG
jgi:hypothetical protein